MIRCLFAQKQKIWADVDVEDFISAETSLARKNCADISSQVCIQEKQNNLPLCTENDFKHAPTSASAMR